jgi:hypothetical protein
MNMGKKFLRFISPEDENQRMSFRYQIARAEAGVEDLCRTIESDAEKIKKALYEHQQRSGHIGLHQRR